jgi:hypothetical protein
MRFKAETILEKALVPYFEDISKEMSLVKMLFGDSALTADTVSFEISNTIDQRAFLIDEDMNASISYWKDRVEGAAKYAIVMLLNQKAHKSLIDILESNEDLAEIKGTGHWCLQEEDIVTFYDDLYSCMRDTTEAEEGMISSIDNLYRDFNKKDIENFAIKTAASNKDYDSLKDFINATRRNVSNHSRTK